MIRKIFRKFKKLPRKLKDSFFVFLFVDKLRQFMQVEILDNNWEERSKEIVPEREEDDADILLIAFRPTGGFGDCIISAKFLDVLMSFAKCRVDVYVSNLEYGKAVYGNRQGVCVKLWDSFRYNTLEGTFCDNNKYDLVITAEHFLRVHYYYLPRLERLAPKLADRIFDLKKNFDSYYPDAGERNSTEALHIHKCEIQGINRYTTLEHNGIFELKDKFTYISFDESKYIEFEKLGLSNKSYITINRGADNMGGGVVQTKVWNMEKYESLIVSLKKQYPEIQIIQIGGKNNELIKGIDRYVMGKSLELTKWILKSSMLHIDCEGGLVHLATQIGIKCVVLFGPTPVKYYGYDENINIVASTCGNCMGRSREWAYSCMLNTSGVPCMDSITVEEVLKPIGYFMQAKEKKEYVCIRKSEKEFKNIAKNVKEKNIAFVNVKDLELISLFQNNEITVFHSNYADASNSNGMYAAYSQKYETRLGDINHIPYRENAFDLIILKYGNFDEKDITAVIRVLKENGKIWAIGE